jgi:hypothetical protein
MSELIPIQDWLKDLRDSILPRQFEQIDEPDDPLEPVFTDEDGTPAQKDQGEFNQKGDLTSEDPDSTEDGGNDAGDSGGGGGDDGGGGGGGGDDGGFDFSESDDGDYKQDEKKQPDRRPRRPVKSRSLSAQRTIFTRQRWPTIRPGYGLRLCPQSRQGGRSWITLKRISLPASRISRPKARRSRRTTRLT